MVETQEIRDAFAARLHKALDRMPGIRPARGRNVDLHAAIKAAGIETTTQATNKWLRGESMPEKDNMRQLAAWLGVRAEWLEYGEGEMDGRAATPAKPIESNAQLIGMMSGWDSSTPLHDDEVAIPLFKEVELAAGHGATEVVEVPGRLLRFAKSTLREAGVQEHNAACATISGTSMERLIMDGATIGIDRGTTNVIDGEIYAFDHNGMLRVKYLYRIPGGGLRVRSENSEEYPDEIIEPDQLSHVRILGWVFWWSTIRRRNGLRLAK